MKSKKLYFIRETASTILDDFPCKGAWEHLLYHSTIKGPYRKKPNIKKEELQYGSPHTQEVVMRMFENDPKNFTQVSYIAYGTRIDEKYKRFCSTVGEADTTIIWQVGRRAFKHFQNTAQQVQRTERGGVPTCSGIYENCLARIQYQRTDWPYAHIHVQLFGEEKHTDKALRSLNLFTLTDAFSIHDREMGIEHCVRHGLVDAKYSITDFQLEDVLNAKEIIL